MVASQSRLLGYPMCSFQRVADDAHNRGDKPKNCLRVSCASGGVELADRQGPTARILSCNSEERSQPGEASG